VPRRRRAPLTLCALCSRAPSRQADFYRLASLACESADRRAAMAALLAAGTFCEREACCRRQHLATLFGQQLAPRGTALPHERCCDVCTALAATTTDAAGAGTIAGHTPGRAPATASSAAASFSAAASPGASARRDVSGVAVDVLRVLTEQNANAAASGQGDGSLAPAKLTCAPRARHKRATSAPLAGRRSMRRPHMPRTLSYHDCHTCPLVGDCARSSMQGGQAVR
jgi:hypothetical protein